ncbi:hypothetical protein L9F63_019882, partial [Diploptera punctata]
LLSNAHRIVLTEPIHYAAINGNSKTLKILLDCTTTKTNINAVDKDGQQREQYTECKDAVLQFDNNVTVRDGI